MTSGCPKIQEPGSTSARTIGRTVSTHDNDISTWSLFCPISFTVGFSILSRSFGLSNTTITKNIAKHFKKPGVTLVLSDVEFAKLISGKANAQNMFMQGKLKIKGNMMAATKLGPILEKAQSKAKL